jgi:aldehyde:ferredoxin oxidoreductase
VKYAGYDVIILEGTSPQPVYLFIDNEGVELREAHHYWGRGTITVEKALKRDLGQEFQIAAVGPAAENLVRFACINHDFGRQAGRGGIGTVMGAKKLKAIAVRGTKRVPVADVGRYHSLSQEMFKACRNSEGLEVWQRYGTAGITTLVKRGGCLPHPQFPIWSDGRIRDGKRGDDA